MECTSLIYIILFSRIVSANIIFNIQDKEEERAEMIGDIITFNIKHNGWNNIFCVGHLPDTFYAKIRHLPFTTTLTTAQDDDHVVEDIVPYHPNVVIFVFKDFDELEDGVLKAAGSPYWHPLSNIILYYHATSHDDIPLLFITLWFFRGCNVIIVQYDDFNDLLLVSYFSPYISDSYKLQYSYGCWKTTKLGRPLTAFRESFKCEEGCHNVTGNTFLRGNNLGTCIGFTTHTVRYGDRETLSKLKLFEDKSKNLHGFKFRANTIEARPFTKIIDNGNGTYQLLARDGLIWTTTAELMNFEIDLTPSVSTLFQPFNFEVNIQLIYSFAKRKADFVLFPIYLFDIVIVEVDFGMAYKDSGVCIMSHRAGYETMLFDIKLMEQNVDLLLRFVGCFLLIWLLFFLFNVAEDRRLSFDQLGKDLLNTIRNVLSVSLYNPPKRRSFRIFLAISIWSFFVINFATQAAIISFFTAYKRGKEVDYFDDVVERGYIVEGMPSPDMMLPETEDRFRKINSKLVSLKDLFGCVNRMSNDSRRFCLIDCSVGRYLAKNRLNEKGEQYLHIAQDRIHSHYLNMIYHKHCPLTATFNLHMRRFFEAGLIQKWEQFRYPNIKEEVTIKSLGMDDLTGIFKCYYLLVGLSSAVFLLEISIGVGRWAKHYFTMKLTKWNRIRVAKKKLKQERKLGNIKHTSTYTQTNN